MVAQIYRSLVANYEIVAHYKWSVISRVNQLWQVSNYRSTIPGDTDCCQNACCCCRAVLAVLYAFLVVFVIVDVTVQTKNYYNLVSLSGIFIYISLMFYFSIAPNKASTLVTVLLLLLLLLLCRRPHGVGH